MTINQEINPELVKKLVHEEGKSYVYSTNQNNERRAVASEAWNSTDTSTVIFKRIENN